ncbi:DUF4252 domain-containing protein [Flavobacteriaceae bacterium S0825]|uniref:DUF4252 domain-containing protein n=1 Tax=Gaetbulibacter sp. S0825 TaxID=2720084 RepID=UPI00142F5FBD|nr:DUF4252 domain-containing protein [Gaetbulibacter sp. S0825]MCK0109335.1 DUF4252 domain-containing protein [Flavobacteriaceae bacterium S0825]NIX64969.1 DUF4252 domain-containing protein [Gaetbulibacter sp. S0825]
MKKLVLIIAILMTPLMSFAQGGLFDKYEDMDGVGSGVVNSKMFQMISSIDIDMDDPDAAAMFEMIKKIKSLKFLTTGDKSISSQMAADVNKYISSSKLEELMRFKDGNQNVKFYVREGSSPNQVKELLMFVSGLDELTKDQNITINGEKREIETVIVSLLGDINLSEISKLTKSMNIPGGEHLKKAGDKKN